MLALEAALYDVQVREFMSPEEAAARRAAEEAGERYESDEDREEEYYVDDDEEELFGDFRDNETYESKVASGLIYPMWDTKFERNKWRESVGKTRPGRRPRVRRRVPRGRRGAVPPRHGENSEVMTGRVVSYHRGRGARRFRFEIGADEPSRRGVSSSRRV